MDRMWVGDNGVWVWYGALCCPLAWNGMAECVGVGCAEYGVAPFPGFKEFVNCFGVWKAQEVVVVNSMRMEVAELGVVGIEK